jgi:hypothetical protein
MEDVLELYEEPLRSEEAHRLLRRATLPTRFRKTSALASKTRPQRYDYDYKREGVRNLFVFFEPQASWRHIDVRERRTAIDFAEEMRKLVDVHYPEAQKVRVVLDNLNTHTLAALYEAFEPQEARRITRKLEFHHTPKHASWLNQAEVEFSVLCGECIGGERIPDEGTLKREV